MYEWDIDWNINPNQWAGYQISLHNNIPPHNQAAPEVYNF